MIDIDDFYNSTVELNKNESESSPNNLKWSQTMFGSIDPVELYGNEVKVFRKVLESHKDVSWDSIIPIIDKDLDRGHVRILDPKANTFATHNPQYIQIDEEIRWEIPPETQQWMYGFVLHSVKSYPDRNPNFHLSVIFIFPESPKVFVLIVSETVLVPLLMI